jgi:hypothetical protein
VRRDVDFRKKRKGPCSRMTLSTVVVLLLLAMSADAMSEQLKAFRRPRARGPPAGRRASHHVHSRGGSRGCGETTPSGQLSLARQHFPINSNPGSEVWAQTTLYFGSYTAWTCRQEVTIGRFQEFMNKTITPLFPYGLTLLNGLGQFLEGDVIQNDLFSHDVILLYSFDYTITVPANFPGTVQATLCPTVCDAACGDCAGAGSCPSCPAPLVPGSLVTADQAIEWIRQQFNCLYLQSSVLRVDTIGLVSF